MDQTFTAEASISVHASPAKVWEALTTPEMVKQYLFGTEMSADSWEVGSSLTYKGSWEGKEYEDKGKILDIEPEKVLATTYWSSFSGLADSPENYQKVTYKLDAEGENTKLTVTQEGNQTQEAADKSKQNWEMVLSELKKVVENSQKTTYNLFSYRNFMGYTMNQKPQSPSDKLPEEPVVTTDLGSIEALSSEFSPELGKELQRPITYKYCVELIKRVAQEHLHSQGLRLDDNGQLSFGLEPVATMLMKENNVTLRMDFLEEIEHVIAGILAEHTEFENETGMKIGRSSTGWLEISFDNHKAEQLRQKAVDQVLKAITKHRRTEPSEQKSTTLDTRVDDISVPPYVINALKDHGYTVVYLPGRGYGSSMYKVTWV